MDANSNQPTIGWDRFVDLVAEYFATIGIAKYPDANTENGFQAFGPLFKWFVAQKVNPVESRAAFGRIAKQETRPRWWEAALEALKLEIVSGRDQSFEAGHNGPVSDMRTARELSWDCRECGGEGLTFRYVEDRVRTHFYPCFCHRCQAGETMRDLHASKAKPGERKKIVDLRDPRFRTLATDHGTIDLTDPVWKIHPDYRSAVATAEVDADSFDDPRDYVARLTAAIRDRVASDRASDVNGRQTTTSTREVLAVARASHVDDRNVSDAQYRRADQARQKWQHRPHVSGSTAEQPAF